jgi:GT2 family glycosyltransferase
MSGSNAVFVVIVNYRTGPLVVECLASLASQVHALRGGRVIVVDNDSGDASANFIVGAIHEKGWSGWAELLVMPRNGGFAYGNNAGIRRARDLSSGFAAILLLNPDAIACAGLIEALVTFLRAHPHVGLAGASIENGDGHRVASAHPDPSPWRELQNGAQLRWLDGAAWREPASGDDARPRRCDWVSGACIAIRREVLETVGPLDEGFFLYFEEVDYCVRARRLGWTCWLVPAARIVHIEGASTGIRQVRRRPTYWYESRRRFFVKRYGIAGLMLADACWAVGRLTLVTRRALRLGGRASLVGEPVRQASDLLLGDLKAVLRGELRASRLQALEQGGLS